LIENWNIPDPVVLYDRPAKIRQPMNQAARQAFFDRLADELQVPALRRRDIGVVVCPTSWTADEDFDLLLEAATAYESKASSAPSAATQNRPTLLMLITGKGPLRDQYQEQIDALELNHVLIETVWLSHDDYQALLTAADLGLCLHRSSSGLDLPMKVSDMFGAQLPVCALEYGPCLTEIVRHRVNGLIFTDAADLAEQLITLFTGFPANPTALDELRGAIIGDNRPTWQQHWTQTAAALFRLQ